MQQFNEANSGCSAAVAEMGVGKRLIAHPGGSLHPPHMETPKPLLDPVLYVQMEMPSRQLIWTSGVSARLAV